jgi:acyl-coenzyme A synthetase/AMP-(fatty) acid ligase
MGITSIVPDMDVTAPGTLTASALGDAVEAIGATMVFASPAALVNAISTTDTMTPSQRAACTSVRLVLSAGAPVRAELLRNTGTIFTAADFHTPYGMTEVLPVADISLTELDEANHDIDTNALGGVCVGRPLPTVEVAIDPIDHNGRPTGLLSTDPGVLGEIIVRAPHAREGYDRLWLTEHRASQPNGWHRSGDIGQLDTSGRLWVGGRLGHVITTPTGPLAPVHSEQLIETLDDVALAAVVGVGPVGTQATVAVIQTSTEDQPVGGASLALVDRIRGVVDDTIDIAAALVVRELPVDRRHNSKIDRAAVAVWATRVLAGERVSSL